MIIMKDNILAWSKFTFDSVGFNNVFAELIFFRLLHIDGFEIIDAAEFRVDFCWN